MRDYDWQCLHEQAEREDMFNEEMDQTEFDRFWGFDLFERIQNEEEARLRKVVFMFMLVFIGLCMGT